MTATLARPTGGRSDRPADPVKTGRSAGWILFGGGAIGYAAIGMLLSLRYNLVDGDGPSRVADAGYVLFSRDPHLGAIGFVWNPLPSLAELPFLLMKGLWAPLQTRGQAGTLQSALFMAAAVVQLRRIALDHQLPPWPRRIVVAAFALNPMIVIFGGNGLSEAAMVFCLVWATRHLMLWLRSDDVAQLGLAGIALSLGYLARYEALAAAMSTAVLVLGAGAWRHRAEHPGVGRRRALGAGAHDAVVLLFPVGISFALWAAAGWLLTGAPFAQFSSQYGNSSQVGQSQLGQVQSKGEIAESILRAVVSLEPLLPTVLVLVLAWACYRRQPGALGPVACFGGVLAFEAAAQLDGLTFGWFRFYITSVPLCICLVIAAWAPNQGRPRAARRWRLGYAVVSFGVLAPSLPVTWSAMLNPVISNQFDQLGLRYLVTADRAEQDTQPQFDEFSDDRAIARYLDAQHLPPASVLTDTYQSWPIWLASSDPHQFVITSDEDFLAALNAPRSYHIRYILVSNPSYDAAVDAVNRRYPDIWASGAGLGQLSMTVVQRGGGESWRIYAVTGTSP